MCDLQVFLSAGPTPRYAPTVTFVEENGGGAGSEAAEELAPPGEVLWHVSLRYVAVRGEGTEMQVRMPSNGGVIEHAYKLARSGSYASTKDLSKALKQQGRTNAELEDYLERSLMKDLLVICKKKHLLKATAP